MYQNVTKCNKIWQYCLIEKCLVAFYNTTNITFKYHFERFENISFEKVIVKSWRLYMGRKSNGDGSVRQLSDGPWECMIQSKYPNPKTGNPKRIKRKASTEKEAVANAKMALTAWEKSFEEGKDLKVSKTKTFGQYMEEYVDGIVKPTITASGYHSYISAMKNNFYPFPISKLQLSMLSKVEFQKYFDTILSLKSRKTCSFPVQLCRRCCKWLVTQSLLKENYAEQAELKKEISDEYDQKKESDIKNRKEAFTPEDIQKFYYAYKNNMGQYPVVVLFLLKTGMRAGEFAALRNDNIDLENNRIHIVETRSLRFKDNDKNNGIEYYTKVPKNKKARYVVMSKLCRECVLYMMEQTKLNCTCNKDNLLYPTFRNGRRRSTSSMEVCFKELCNKLDIDRDGHLTERGNMKGLCLHSLRHTADTLANTAKNANVVNTALMMGHTAISVENVYTHATDEALSSVRTPSQAVLDEYKISDSSEEKESDSKNQEDKEKELYEMYLKLKEKFEG